MKRVSERVFICIFDTVCDNPVNTLRVFTGQAVVGCAPQKDPQDPLKAPFALFASKKTNAVYFKHVTSLFIVNRGTGYETLRTSLTITMEL